jgi:hypothetical protein
LVYCGLRESRVVTQWFEHLPVEQWLHVHTPTDSIRERNLKNIRAYHLYVYDGFHGCLPA